MRTDITEQTWNSMQLFKTTFNFCTCSSDDFKVSLCVFIYFCYIYVQDGNFLCCTSRLWMNEWKFQHHLLCDCLFASSSYFTRVNVLFKVPITAFVSHRNASHNQRVDWISLDAFFCHGWISFGCFKDLIVISRLWIVMMLFTFLSYVHYYCVYF